MRTLDDQHSARFERLLNTVAALTAAGVADQDEIPLLFAGLEVLSVRDLGFQVKA